MKLFYYYLRNEQGHPVVTICLGVLGRTKDIARGIGICSPSDTVCKKEGRRWARKRTMKAFGLQKTSNPIQCDEPVNRIEALKTLQSVKDSEVQILPKEVKWDFLLTKSAFNPTLMDFEKEILKEDI